MALTPELIKDYLAVTYVTKDQTLWEDATNALLEKTKATRVDLIKNLQKAVQETPPATPEEAQNFVTHIPLSKWWESPFHALLIQPMIDAKLPIPNKSSQWSDNIVKQSVDAAIVTAGILDFPRKQLPSEVWLYEENEPLPRLQPKLRATILREARYRLSKFGAKLIGCMLYGGAASYQYHKGADIDCSLYIDWNDFKGSEEIMEAAFKNVELPWEGYVLHMFVKPPSQTEQIEVADASYDVFNDEWSLPPLILPKDFDPNIYFAPLIESAEKKAEKIDLLMGRVNREWGKLKAAIQARKEGPRDENMVDSRIDIQKAMVLELVDKLCKEFVGVWTGRRKLHDELRKTFVAERNVDRFIRFQPPEVTWKYLDQAGYAEFLKVLAKAHEAGSIKYLLDQL